MHEPEDLNVEVDEGLVAGTAHDIQQGVAVRRHLIETVFNWIIDIVQIDTTNSYEFTKLLSLKLSVAIEFLIIYNYIFKLLNY